MISNDDGMALADWEWFKKVEREQMLKVGERGDF